MHGVLKGIIDRAQPLAPELKIQWADNSFRVFVKRQRYTMGIIPQFIGETEEELADIDIEHDEENDRIVVLVIHGDVHRIPATVATSGQTEQYEWRIDDAAQELAGYLKDLAAQ